jgi:hypothetical protein
MTNMSNLTPAEIQAAGSFTKRMTIRKRVASACILCKKSRMRCDDQRPCKRCLRFGKEKLCSLPTKTSNSAHPQAESDFNEVLEVEELNSNQSRNSRQEQLASTFDSRYVSWCPVPTRQQFSTITYSSPSNTFLSQNYHPSCEPPPSGPSDRFVPSSLHGPQPAIGTQAALMEQLLARQRQEILGMIANMVGGPSICPAAPAPARLPGTLPSLVAVQAAATAPTSGPSQLSLAPLRLPYSLCGF